MDKNYNSRNVADILMVIKELSYNMPNESIYIQVTTTSDIIDLEITSENDTINELNTNIFIHNKIAIDINEIVKIKILTNSIQNEQMKTTIVNELKNILNYNYRQKNSNQPIYQRRSRYKNYNKDISSFIEGNYSEIEAVSYNSNEQIEAKEPIINTNKETVLTDKTILEIKRNDALDKVSLNLEKCNIINSIDKTQKEVITDIEVEEINVLTEYAKEVEVAKPIETESIKVITDVEVGNYNIEVNVEPTTVVKDITHHKSKALLGINKNYLEGVIGNINKEKQIINTKIISYLDIEPINKYVCKKELHGKPLVLDPTDEKYIGVILEDGTFEPLKLEFKNITILQDEVKNVLSNLNPSSQIRTTIEEIEEVNSEFVDDVKVINTEKVTKYTEENIVPIKKILKTSSKVVNSVINQNEVVNVVTKDISNTIKNIKKINTDVIENIGGIETTPVIKNVELTASKNKVIEDVKLIKDTSNVIKKIDIDVDKGATIKLKDKIDGVVELAIGGIMLVNNKDNITVYNTTKISSVN